jgi:hypothetical protein
MREAITQPNPKTHSHAKYCTYWGKTFAQMGTFYPRVTIVFLFSSVGSPDFCGKYTLNDA